MHKTAGILQWPQAVLVLLFTITLWQKTSSLVSVNNVVNEQLELLFLLNCNLSTYLCSILCDKMGSVYEVLLLST